MLTKTVQSHGRYTVNVSREEDNFYAVDGGAFYLRTQMCLSLALASDAILNWRGYGGELIFIDEDERCDVSEIYAPIR